MAVVIPAFNEARRIAAVLRGLPAEVRYVIVVDDGSKDGTADVVRGEARTDTRIALVVHTRNQGVGGAMISGFKAALATDADVVVKMDGDGQMDPLQLDALVAPLAHGQADFSKGNRFHDFAALAQMPLVRRIGNLALSFLVKAASGYWRCVDPTNGFVAIRADVLRRLPLDRLSRGYFFETSLLCNLSLLGAVVRDIPMPARYGDEVSKLSVRKVLMTFPWLLAQAFARRIFVKNLFYDFTIEGLYLLTGLPMLVFGVFFGLTKWVHYAMRDVPAPTGTIMIAVMTVTLGFQILLAAVNLDIQAEPSEPLSQPLAPSRAERKPLLKRAD